MVNGLSWWLGKQWHKDKCKHRTHSGYHLETLSRTSGLSLCFPFWPRLSLCAVDLCQWTATAQRPIFRKVSTKGNCCNMHKGCHCPGENDYFVHTRANVRGVVLVVVVHPRRRSCEERSCRFLISMTGPNWTDSYRVVFACEPGRDCTVNSKNNPKYGPKLGWARWNWRNLVRIERYWFVGQCVCVNICSRAVLNGLA